jgi:imidazolonepropionase
VWRGARIATMSGDAPYGLVDDGALAVDGAGRIAWVGPRSELPAAPAKSAVTRDAGGRCMTPGLIDCHTHIVYAGNRAHEFEQRLSGTTYPELARSGGGILSTVRATRAASEDQLATVSGLRLAALARSGVTTIEIKSGYGLDRDTELRMLRVARALGRRHGVEVHGTYLGLHAKPSEGSDAKSYLDMVVGEVLPAVAGERLADAVDAFCEPIAFSADDISRFFAAARALGLGVKVHADQLSDGGGAALAARYGALSADHLEWASEGGLRALRAAGTVAVLLPGAYYFLSETHAPPVEALRRLGIPIAIASDCNPGTSPLVSLPLALNLACTLFKLTPEEALAGVTRNAARALGIGSRLGALTAGREADFVLWDIEHPRELSYAIGAQPVHAIVKRGNALFGA